MTYAEYLKTDHWAKLSTERKDIDGHKCVCCGSTDKLEVHHCTYENGWYDTSIDDLRTVCHKCHRLVHQVEEVLEKHADCPMYRNAEKPYDYSFYTEIVMQKISKLIAIRLWESNIIEMNAAIASIETIVYIVRENGNGWNNLRNCTNRVRDYLALAKDFYIANPEPKFNAENRKQKRLSHTRYKR